MSTAIQNLPPTREERADQQPAPLLDGGQVFSALEQSVFIEMLRLERHRSQRSGQPFLLVLIEGFALPRRSRRATFRRIVRAIASCTRETDVVGWYERGKQLGLLMTEIGQANDRDIDLITRRLRDCLISSVDPEVYGFLKIRLRVYPEGASDRNGGPTGGVNREAGYQEWARFARRSPGAQWLKRALDICGSVFFLVLLSPLFLILAVMVKLSSPGPVFFRQTRLGRHGKEFDFFKFRTMYTNCDSAVHEAYVTKLISGDCDAGQGKGTYKLQNDPRITPLGRFLRNSSLDELPQFFNVLRDDMSLVGPRPPLPYEYERYKPWHKRRVLEMKPGITGLWQVEGRSRTTFEQMVRLDLRYGRFRSLWTDIRILLRTPSAVIGGRGAC